VISSSSILLSTAYLPPVQYISKFITHVPVLIEKHENYQKQSYRNRCYIYGANGKQCLVIPVKKQGIKTPVSEVEIDNQYGWQKIHLKSIESAYRLSAFYEYYADDFRRFYEKECRFLYTLNMELLQLILSLMGIHNDPDTTKSWESIPVNCIDYRQSIHPKLRLALPDDDFNPQPYQQVFQERYGFIPNLSVIDLLFNEGPLAAEVLKKSVKSNE
jgi:hypothetical protein